MKDLKAHRWNTVRHMDVKCSLHSGSPPVQLADHCQGRQVGQTPWVSPVGGSGWQDGRSRSQAAGWSEMSENEDLTAWREDSLERKRARRERWSVRKGERRGGRKQKTDPLGVNLWGKGCRCTHYGKWDHRRIRIHAHRHTHKFTHRDMRWHTEKPLLHTNTDQYLHTPVSQWQLAQHTSTSCTCS